LWLAALVTLLSLGLASKPLGLNARSISSEQTGGLMLNNEETGTIVIEKQTDPDGATGTFDFTDDIEAPYTFSLADDGQQPFTDVVSGTYTITETSPAPAFDLTDLTCEDPDQGSSIDLGAGAATIDLDAGETITCTFTNTQRGTIIPVGGYAVSVNRLTLLAPWLGLVALASLAALTVALVRRRRG